VRRISVPVAVRRIAIAIAVGGVSVAAVTAVTVGRIAVAVAGGPVRETAADHGSRDTGTDPATDAPRLRRLRGSDDCCGKARSCDDGRCRLLHGVVLREWFPVNECSLEQKVPPDATSAALFFDAPCS